MALTEPFDPNTLAALSITSSGTEDNDTIIAAIPTLNDGLSDGDALSDFSLSNVGKEVIPNCGGGLGSLNCLATKILYYINDQPMAYVKQIPVSSEQITLGDVKRELNMPNFKYFCMHFDQDYNTDVKSELINDYEPLLKTQAKTYVLHLKEREESIHSDPSTYQPRLAIRNGLVPGPAPNQGIFGSSDYNYRKGRIPDYSMNTTDSESCISSIKPVPNSYGFRPKYPVNGRYQGGNDSSRFDDYDQDTRCHSDDESRVSISTDLTSVSRQGLSRRRKKKRNYRQPSRASSDTSLGESSMCLDVITVVLNMDDGFLGISIVGNSNARGDNGIYVAAIIDKGAVALDGRIEQNDMILQVNDVSFENFTNDQAVNVLRDAVARKGMLKLTVAKSFNSGWRNGNCNRPNIREEPVEPIDTNEWIKHASRCCEFLKKENKIPGGMPSIQEGSEGAPTPVPGHKGNFYFGQGNGRQSGSQATSNDSDGAPSTIVGRNGNNGFGIMRSGMQKLSYTVDPKLIVQAMALPNSGLEIKERTWLKITIPDSFVGSDLVSWLLENVSGFKNRKDAKNFASELLQQKLITHYVNKPKFTEQCYYLFGESCRDYLRYRLMNGNNEREMVNECLYYPPPPPIPSGMGTLTHPNKGQQWQNYQGNSLVSGYAAMPISSYPGQGMMLPPRISNDMNSKVSGGTSNDGSSGSEHRRINQPAKAILPPAPSLNSIQNHYASTGILVANMNGMAHHRLDEMPPELSGSRQSFRFAMNSNDMNGEYYLRNV
uniref:PDZ domain-containing protein n=1 Tax=Rhabditophanes sp. KR3021 TaxID=114890 RepID=A0AC35U309_9BILA